MTTAERLREFVHRNASYLLTDDRVAVIAIAAELDQRDDTIAQLRAERDALARERDRLRKAIEDAASAPGKDWLKEQIKLAYTLTGETK